MKINQLTTDDLAFLEKLILQIMDKTDDLSVLVAAAELLSEVRSRQSPREPKPKKKPL